MALATRRSRLSAAIPDQLPPQELAAEGHEGEGAEGGGRANIQGPACPVHRKITRLNTKSDRVRVRTISDQEPKVIGNCELE